jgi:hypothetical protein
MFYITNWEGQKKEKRHGINMMNMKKRHDVNFDVHVDG